MQGGANRALWGQLIRPTLINRSLWASSVGWINLFAVHGVNEMCEEKEEIMNDEETLINFK